VTTCDLDRVETESVLRFLSHERKKVLSLFEFKHRLRNYGYCLKRSEGVFYVLTLPHRKRVCALPRELLS